MPDALTKLTQMGDATLFEPAGDQPSRERESNRAPREENYQSHSLSECITNITTPSGSKPILKTMLTTACERNCYYCPFRAGRSRMRRISFTPDEMAGAFHTLVKSRQVDGLFLSSGILKGGVSTQDRLLDTAEIIRRRYDYRGYVHLKIMPGAESDQLYRAMQLADRVSVNLEGATEARLHALAPKKNFNAELLPILIHAAEIRRQHPGERLASTVTQFVVGAVGDTDLELLSISEKLYQQAGLSRVYYSSFSPVLQTPFENLPRTDPLREHRLYQASFLLRDYGWNVEELAFQSGGNLPIDTDPKRAWADVNLQYAPVELMTADREQLMRVPGIGPVTADAIVQARRTAQLTELTQLRKLGFRAPEQAAPYILLSGRRPPTQGTLF
ncbi:MAG: helix-hairpin-helix domain-containing protein [Aggregatilineales bacterium]